MVGRCCFGLLLLGATACSSSVVFEDDGGEGGEGGDWPNGGGTDSSSGAGVTTNVLDRLAKVPGLTIHEATPHYPGYRSFEGTFRQPADHAQPNGLQFEQRIRIMHRDLNAATVLFSTGYDLIDFDALSEPALLVDGNQVSIEHRFFMPSRPEPADWQTLRIEQAAADHHRLIVALKAVYPERWVSTGNSKGGMASIYHRRFFPDDVDGTIAYVTPLSYGLHDERFIPFLDQVFEPGLIVPPSFCRDRMKALQIDALSRRDRLRPMITALGLDFGALGEDGALDFGVQWLRFTSWQYGGEEVCDVPGAEATDQEVLDYLVQHSPLTSMTTEDLAFSEPYYFQAAVELGDPAIDESYLAPLLSLPLGMSAQNFVTPGPTKELVFDAAAMPDIQDWVLGEGSQLLFVYGQYDPWSAAAVHVSGMRDTHALVVPFANHGAGISDLTDLDPLAASDAEDAISRWAGTGGPVPTPHPAAGDIEIARAARLADSAPRGVRRARFEQRARELLQQAGDRR